LVHKANNLKLTEGLFLDVAKRVAQRYPSVRFDDMLADTACSSLVLEPEAFDVILTSNTIGDLLSNLGAALAGSLGLVGSLNSGDGLHIAEAAHGDAAQLAGRDAVNPIAFFDGIRLLTEALGERGASAAIGHALRRSQVDGIRTLDLGGEATTSEVTEHICDAAKAYTKR
jgi:isocitrate dehydrogenase (NAD+)